MAQALLAPSLLQSKIGNFRSSIAVLPRGTQFLASSFTQNYLHASNMRVQRTKANNRALSSSIRCEQGAKEGQKGADVWLGRLAMIGFATAITIEVSTGKGLLENLGLVTPQQTLALFVTALVIGLTVFFIFQSASKD